MIESWIVLLKRSLIGSMRRGHQTLRYSAIAKAKGLKFIFPTRLSVGWILCGGNNVGSSRIHGINLHEFAKSQWISSFIVNQPDTYNERLDIDDYDLDILSNVRFDIVIFQRVHAGRTLELIERLKSVNTTTIFFAADLYESAAYLTTDYVFTVSDALRDELVNRGVSFTRIHVVPDAIETDESLCKEYIQGEPSELKIAWVGAAGHWRTLDSIRSLLRSDSRLGRFQLLTISNHANADIQWSLNTVWDEILKCDIGIVPVDTDTPQALVKSNNRVTMFKALGLPVICSKLPAYEDVIADGETGFIANTPAEWGSALLALVDPAVRKRIGLAGRMTVFNRFGMRQVGLDFCDLLHSIKDRQKLSKFP